MQVKPHILYLRNSFDQKYILLHLIDFPDGVEFHHFRKSILFESTAQFLANISALHNKGRVKEKDGILFPVLTNQNILYAVDSDFSGSEEECLAELKRLAIEVEGYPLIGDWL